MRPGDLVAGRFVVERFAGRGGMGTVYRARDRESGRAVALKVVSEADATAFDRFEREAVALEKLHHPGIVEYVAHGTADDGARFLAMEWLAGTDLESRLAGRGITASESVTMAIRVADALAIAHRSGIVHRDIKPSNIFLVDDDAERVKVLDFGIARVGTSRTRITQTGTVLGTPAYMAPEQVRGANNIDGRADLFSLGCVLFECIAGRSPFDASENMTVLARILLDDAPRLGSVMDGISPPLDDLVAWLLAKPVEARAPDASAVAAALRALGDVGTARTSVVPDRKPSLTEREQRLVCVALAETGLPTLTDASEATIADAGDPALVQSMRESVAPFGLTLDHLAGGTVIAMLHGTGSATSQAERGARAALALRASAPEARMSLVIGRAVLSERVPLGEAIDRAVALLKASPPARGERAPIRIDELTAGLLDTRFEIEGDSTGLVLRGVRESPEATRTLLGKETPCVGREAELAQLEALFAACLADSEARAVVITAAEGIGKSRVRAEFAKRIAGRAEIWIGRGNPASEGAPFGSLAPMIRRTANLDDAEPLEVRRQKLRARVSRHVPPDDVARVSAFLGELIGTPYPSDSIPQLEAARADAAVMADQLAAAWLTFLEAELRDHPIAVILDDLQWGDLPSVRFVDSALDHLRDLPLFALALGRPEMTQRFGTLWRDRGVLQLGLGELRRKSAERLVRVVLGDTVGENGVNAIVERAGGNAFYLEELIRAAAEGRSDGLPETIRAIVHTRLEGFEPEARRALRAASVFGTVFWAGGVASLLGDDEGSRSSEWLGLLTEREVIARRTERRFRNEPEYIFRSELTRETAYGMLTDSDRRLGHRLAGEWLERLGESDALTLAQHFERGGDAANAVRTYHRAAMRALASGDTAGAVERAERGLGCGATGDDRALLQLVIAEASRWTGDNERGAARAADALEHATLGTDTWFTAAGEFGIAGSRVARLAEVDMVGSNAMAAFDPAHASAAAMIALHRLAFSAFQRGQIDRFDRMIALVDESTRHRPRVEPTVRVRQIGARAAKARLDGDPVRYLALTEEAIALFEEMGDERSICNSQINGGYGAIRLGLDDRAAKALRAALTRAERLNATSLIASANQNLGRVLGRLGRTDEALAAQNKAASLFEAQRNQRMHGASLVYLAETAMIAGDLAAVETHARAVLAVASSVPALRAFARSLLAITACRRADVRTAEELIREPVALLDSPGAVDECEGWIRVANIEVLLASGRTREAREAAISAREHVRARAERIADKAWRTCFEAIPEHAWIARLAAD